MNARLPRQDIRPLKWVGSARKDLKEFPEPVQHDIGVALFRVQTGDTPLNAKQLKGFKGVWEIRDDYDSDTYRAVYAVRFRRAIYVLHTFMKKSKQGIKTPESELNVIRTRLRSAEQDYGERYPDENS